MAKKAVAKFKAKALVKTVARVRSLESQSRRLQHVSDNFTAKPIVGPTIVSIKEKNEYVFSATQLNSTSASRRRYEASVIKQLKLREQRTKFLYGVGQQKVAGSAWASLRQDALRKLASKPLSRRRRRRRTSNFKSARVLPDGEILANIDRLQSLLGLTRESVKHDVTFVSIDCEFGKYSGTQYVTEIGITTLRASDIMGIPPGAFARNWNSKLKHHHMIVNYGKVRRWQVKPALFTKSQHVDGRKAKSAMQTIMRELIPSGSDSGRVALVGHSTITDIEALIQCPDLQVDIRTIGGPDLRVLNVFDTYWLGLDAKKNGADLPGLSLGAMANSIGIDPVYRTTDAVRDWHNASNDAAYTMMCLLLFAADWNVITGKVVRNAVDPKGIRRVEEANGELEERSAHVATLPIEGTLSSRRPRRRIASKQRRHEDAIARAKALPSKSAPRPSWLSWLTALFWSRSSPKESAGRGAAKEKSQRPT